MRLTRIPSSTFSPPYTFIPSSSTPISPRNFLSATRIPMTEGLLKQREIKIPMPHQLDWTPITRVHFYLLSRQGGISEFIILGCKTFIHAPQRPVKGVSRRWVLNNLQVIVVDFVKHRGHHHGPVCFDLRQKGFSPAQKGSVSTSQARQVKGDQMLPHSYHISWTSMCASKIATTSAVAALHPETLAWERPFCSVCLTRVKRRPGFSFSRDFT